MSMHNAIDYPIDDIRKWIADGQTQAQIAERLAKSLDSRITAKLIYKVCKRNEIQCQRTGPRAGEGHPDWTGGVVRQKGGYIKVYCPEHPNCQRINANRAAKANGKFYQKAIYVWQHRLVMETHLGRLLKPNEVVHHINGNPSDNRIENLQLFHTNASHLKHELTGRKPEWTEAGKARIQAGVDRWRANRRLLKERRALEQQQTNGRPKG